MPQTDNKKTTDSKNKNEVSLKANGVKTLKPQNDYIFSLDIGTRTVVGIVGEERDENFVLLDYYVEPHNKRAMIDGQIEDIKLVAKIVAKVKEQLENSTGIQFSRVSIAAAGRALRTRQVIMDFDIAEHEAITYDMIKSMELEAVHKAQTELDDEFKAQNLVFYCVGHSVMRYMLDDYKIINLEGHKGRRASVELIATFLPNIVVEGLYSVMDANRLSVESLTLEPIAGMNVIVPPEIRLINIAFVDIGAGTSDIAISRDGTIVAYAMATTAGDEITEEIIRLFFVDFATAEKMKHLSTSGATEFEYRDIFGITQKVKTEDFNKKIEHAVESLAEIICTNILTVNGSSPAAVFLVGGGSLISGLAEKVSKKLGIDETRVAIGSNNNLRSVDTQGKQMGAEFITPIGIAVTSILNRGYDFSLITLNGEKVRIFDTKKLTVFDILTMQGYKTYEIMGRSGRNLTFSVNGKHQTVKGTGFTPSEIYINNAPASINSEIAQGDSIKFIPAKSGENAHATIGEILSLPTCGKVTFGGEKHEIGALYFIKGEAVSAEHDIKPLENIETVGIITLEDLLQHLEVEFTDVVFTVNGETEPLSHILQDGDIVDYEAPSIRREEISKQSKQINSEHINKINDLISMENNTAHITPEHSEITVTFNGNELKLPTQNGQTPHLFLELFNFIEIDTEKPNGNYSMLLNGEDATFNSEIKNGDIAVLKWE